MKQYISIGLIFFSISVFSQKKWTLQECVIYAAENNLTVQQNKVNEAFSVNSLNNAKNQWLPTVDGYINNSLALGTNNPLIDKGYQQYTNSLGINSSITIYNGGVVNLNKEKALLEVESSRKQTESLINDISLMIVNHYLNVMLNRELKQIAEGNLAIAEQQVERIQKQLNAGSVARADLVRAEANLAQEKKNVADAQIEVERALFNMAVLLQLPDYREFDVEMVPIPENIELGLYDLNAIVEVAYAQQPAIQKAEIDVQVAEKSIDIAKTGFKPTITGTYNLGTNYADYFNKGLVSDAWLSQWHDNLTNVFGLNVQVPIFEKFNNKLNVERASINQSQAQINLELEKQTIRENIQEAYFSVNTSYQAYEAAKESVRSNALSYDYAQRSYDAGVLNIYDLNQAQNSLAVAEAQMAQAKYNFIFRLKVLDFYAGIPLTLD